MGTVQMSLPLEEIEALPASAARPAKTQTHVRFTGGTEGPASKSSSGEEPLLPELDIRGVRLEEAMSRLERYLDQVFRYGSFAEVIIIHGLGTGALREGTLQLLRELPYVKTFRDAGAGRGGTGATIVEFDRN
jgi:DNA mismatch repair protein MutS2